MYTAAPLPYSSGCLLIQVNLWGPTIHRQNVPAKAPMRQPRICGISMECIVKDCMVGRSKEVQTLGATLIGYNFWSRCQSDYCYILTDSLRWMEAVEKILRQKIKTIKKRCNTRTSLEVTLLSLAQACWIAIWIGFGALVLDDCPCHVLHDQFVYTYIAASLPTSGGRVFWFGKSCGAHDTSTKCSLQSPWCENWGIIELAWNVLP